jgi:hypothetical protein
MEAKMPPFFNTDDANIIPIALSQDKDKHHSAKPGPQVTIPTTWDTQTECQHFGLIKIVC